MSVTERPASAKGARRFQRRARAEVDKRALQMRTLEAARKEFASGTLETVSIQKIADALGYSKGTVLKYFPTKILLLLAVKQQNLEEIADRLERIRERNSDSEIRLRRGMEAPIHYLVGKPHHFPPPYFLAGAIHGRRVPPSFSFCHTP